MVTEVGALDQGLYPGMLAMHRLCAHQKLGSAQSLQIRIFMIAMQVPGGYEDAVCSLAKLERAIVSCPAAKARHKGPGCLVPAPPNGVDRVELELQLLSMIQVQSAPFLS